jgi:hypothetical protein|tara:strand:- start:289 stop:570 length:282 start_codon:yes stop_codon:yes gene_type:complete
MIKRLKFTNRDIHNWKSDFSPGPTSKTGKSKERVYTAFAFSKTTQLKGLNLCEYKKGEKHFVIKFRIKGQRDKKRVFNLGKFNNNKKSLIISI